MNPVVEHRGTVIPLDRTSVDTDAIIPGKYCLTTNRSGFAEHLFDAWRDQTDFPLNAPDRREASILVAGPDFGTGSSREHAVWALQDWGFRVVVSSRFGDIFYNNCAKAGLVAAQVDEDIAQALIEESTTDPHLLVTVDLRGPSLRWTDDGGRETSGDIYMDPYTQRRFLEGLDDIDITLQHDAAIASYEDRNAHRLPSMDPKVNR